MLLREVTPTTVVNGALRGVNTVGVSGMQVVSGWLGMMSGILREYPTRETMLLSLKNAQCERAKSYCTK